MLFKFGLNYVTPLLQSILSYNRLHAVSKYERLELIFTLLMFVTVQIMVLEVAPLFVWANLNEPISQKYVLYGIFVDFLISCLFVYALVKHGTINSLIKEANAMTKEQHIARRKAFVLRFVFLYMLTPMYLTLFCLLFQTCRK